MSRHRFMKNIQDDDDYGDYDSEVYDVYDMVIDDIPDISLEEIYDALIDFDFDVDDTADYFLEEAAKGTLKKKNNKKKTSSNQSNQSNNQQQSNNQPKVKPSTLGLNLGPIYLENIELSSDEFTLRSLYNQKDISKNERILPFHFNDPSPDDIILNKQKLAFGQINNSVLESIKGLNISNNQSTTTKISSTPTPHNTPTNNNNFMDGSGSQTSSSSSSSSHSNINILQHSINRKKELENLVHENFTSKETKSSLNMVVIGHVDAGKSTTMGHLLFKVGAVDQRTIAKFERESLAIGKGSFHFAWVLDEHTEERERGVTMDVCVRYFETKHRRVTLLDAPGHRDFVPNMISGATQADVGVLLINASEFESGFCEEGQTREHAVLAKSLGIVQLIVAINKMDMIDWNQQRYQYIVDTLTVFLTSIKFTEANLRFVPISGFKGDNLIEKSSNSNWYNGQSLVDLIDTFSIGERLINKPFRMGINDIYKSTSKGSVSVGGKVEAGVIGVGDKLLISPGQEICTIKAIKRANMDSEWAVGGDNVDLGLSVDVATAIRVGSILCDPEKPIKTARVFQAQIVTFTVPVPITNGYQAVFHAHAMEEPATITKLVSLMDNAGGVSKKNPRCVGDSASAVVEITLSRPACLELYSNYRQLGRFTLRESGKTIAAGIITMFLDKKKKKSN
ncbi:Hsp70 subfamily B suppressor 1 [Cavenderia fasciculata]|uniref:Hsp70 subfamily B suppressor 1 n=1 Tax=Cavenderia fasciculata TaxID=261658 RepID=F4PS70_CACFS|nr:Hsp70 subfamily B suppressor 1 [Cavenderia fasciculata]EGG21453.1 Hsp70 subfamily B suppressor 1 [Cavenderia fasciculata]|eukprot:XP_004359303.1 Hsp70 subfamily B suppressor 1 [Cavenderia fasciculata]